MGIIRVTYSDSIYNVYETKEKTTLDFKYFGAFLENMNI